MRKLFTSTLLALVVLVGVVAVTGFYRIDEGQQGLVLTFGRITDVRNPGFYWRMPGIQEVHRVSTTHISNMELGFRTHEQAIYNSFKAPMYDDESVPAEEGIMITGDDNLVQVEAVLQYTIQDAQSYLHRVDNPLHTLQVAFETVLRRNIQNKNLDDALLNKQTIEVEVLPELQRMADAYQLGLQLREVRIQNISVPGEVIAAYEDVNNAKNEKTRKLDEAERYKNEVLPAARSRSYELVQQAESYKKQTVASAKGETEAFLSVLDRYKSAEEITRTRLRIETFERIMQKAGRKYIIDGSDGVLKFLPMADAGLTGGTSAGASATPSPTPTPSSMPTPATTSNVDVPTNTEGGN